MPRPDARTFLPPRPTRKTAKKAMKKWTNFSPGVRWLIIVTAGAEGALKLAALIDLARRPAKQVRGSKLRWALAIAFVNSLGAVPISYFLRGRRKP